jgi:Cu(I)/Ag(I) efflux system membrane fusion protein/cobalt-zinc-cadmium efflux system membrane fusion protein
MSAAKYVLATSLIWAAALAALFLYVRHSAQHPVPPSGPPAPIAMAPSSPSSMASMAPATMPPPLSPVQLTPDQMRSIGLTTGTAEYKQINDDLRATGSVAINDRLVSYVQVRFSGYLRQVFVNATYQTVKKGDPLFTIYSPDLVATEQEYLLANDNQRALGSSSIRGVAAGARSLSSAAERRLEQWEIPADQIDTLKHTGKALTDITIQSPASGYIVERNAFPNMFAEPGTRLYTIADLSRVWVNAQVFQSDIARLKPGSAATVTVDAYPQKTFSGHVEEVLPQLDAATRTVPVRLLVENPGLLLKPGMFVNVNFKSSLGRSLVVPASAVLQTGLKQYVFLSKPNGLIEPKEVILGAQSGSDIVILHGLDDHQPIVTSASFLIDSESQLQAASGASMQDMPAATPSQSAAPAPSSDIEFVTHPDPPQMGSNQIRVNLAGKGAPVSGAEVAVTFFMPAMPQMGMAAMSANAKLSESGPGLYTGSADLSMGGTWQVTITAKLHGQLIATKKLSVNAKGGM